MKELFAQFREQGIIYGYYIDFKFSGGHDNFFKTIWDKCTKFRNDFGTLPFASSFDADAEKIRTNGKFDYINDYNDCLCLMVHNILKLFQLRGGEEVSQFLLIF